MSKEDEYWGKRRQPLSKEEQRVWVNVIARGMLHAACVAFISYFIVTSVSGFVASLTTSAIAGKLIAVAATYGFIHYALWRDESGG